jgi:hypothetical protein
VPQKSTEPLVVYDARSTAHLLVKQILGRPSFDAGVAAQSIVREIATLGAVGEIDRDGTLWSVSSELDWLPSDDPMSVFRRARPLRADLPYSCHVEVLLPAFCRFVATGVGSRVDVVRNDDGRRPPHPAAAARRYVWFAV